MFKNCSFIIFQINGKLLEYFIFTNMSKRTINTHQKTTEIKKSCNWSLRLTDSMKDPELIIEEDATIVIIKDKYPKAKIHYLVLPKTDISGIRNLEKKHIELLKHFDRVAQDIKLKHKGVPFKVGFHAVPSMQPLHMHIISEDMISPCLKTKIHWNSFTTDFFLPLENVLTELENNGCIKTITPELHKQYLATPLKCNQCNFSPKNMPNLKEHLLTHDNL